MTITRMQWILISLFFTCVLVAVTWVNFNRPKLLILHSYDTDYVWTKDVDEGIERVLGHDQFIHIRRFYMKTKKFSDKASLKRAGIVARRIIEQTHPDVLLAVDDYAQKLAAKYFINDPNIRIVFAGINGRTDVYGYDKARNVTGILERKPVRGIVEAIASIYKGEGAPRAMFLGDKSLTVLRDAEYLADQDWSPVNYLGAEYATTFSEWKKRVLALRERTDFLLVGGYRKLARSSQDSDFVTPEEVMQWTEKHSPVPVIGMNAFNSKDGIMLSIGVSPYEQGEVSARMALELLREQKAISDIPVQTSRQFIVAMHGKDLEERGIIMPKLYEAFARATQNYYE